MSQHSFGIAGIINWSNYSLVNLMNIYVVINANRHIKNAHSFRFIHNHSKFYYMFKQILLTH